MSVIRKENKLFKNYKKSGLETVTDLLQKGSPENYVKEKQTLFSKKKKKIEKNANNSMELLFFYKYLGMKSGKVNQSKIALRNDCIIQFEPTKNANNFKDFGSDSVGNLVRELPVALNKFENNWTK